MFNYGLFVLTFKNHCVVLRKQNILKIVLHSKTHLKKTNYLPAANASSVYILIFVTGQIVANSLF